MKFLLVGLALLSAGCGKKKGFDRYSRECTPSDTIAIERVCREVKYRDQKGFVRVLVERMQAG